MTQPPSPSAAALEAAKDLIAKGLPNLPHQVGGQSTYREWVDWLAKFGDTCAAQAVAAERAKPAASDLEQIKALEAQLRKYASDHSSDRRYTAIAAALAERGRVERERAAKISDGEAEYYRNIYVLEGFPEDLKRRDAAERIAAAIRNHTLTETNS